MRLRAVYRHSPSCLNSQFRFNQLYQLCAALAPYHPVRLYWQRIPLEQSACQVWTLHFCLATVQPGDTVTRRHSRYCVASLAILTTKAEPSAPRQFCELRRIKALLRCDRVSLLPCSLVA